MIGNIPNIPGGTDPEAIWKRSVEERLRSLRIMDVPGAIVQRTSGRGIAIIPKGTVRGTSAPPPPSVKLSMFVVKELFADYIRCHTFDPGKVDENGDPAEEGTDDVLVAKPFKLRNNITTATLDGVRTDYTYDTTTVKRLAKTALDQEIQIVIPRYLLDPGDIIYAAECKNGNSGVSADGVTIKWVDVNVDGRAWARKYIQSNSL